MAYFSKYKFQTSEENDNKLIKGYTKDGKDIYNLYPRFNFRISTKTTDHEALIKNYNDIYKIIRKDKFEVVSKYIDNKLFRGLNVFSSSSNFSKSETNIRIEVNVKPTEDEVKKIIENYFEFGENCGLVFSKQNKTIWLDEIKLNREITCDLKIRENGLFDFEDLLEKVKPYVNF
ncbi:hypothetical protein [Algoriphagus mannitolivorans]|uniref:hypothetical protein n=1 Tax=Algoriphagus mannitolivorans TaxID=226504 RepID=UPI0003FD7C0F|nr:hypothetical protein [Algoriphagus mannitolivorans]